jgi:uncharacterized protein (DUF305 family)
MKRTFTLTAAAVAATILLAACGSDDPEPGGTADMDDQSSSSSAPDSGQSATGTPASGDHNDADIVFAQMMIPHHGQAVEMSDMLLAKDDVDQRVLELAHQIKDAQQPEITRMSGWLKGWGEDVPDMDMDMGMGAGMGDMDHSMDGMMSPEDMQALEDASGAGASALFLEQMTQHHNGAIDMAETELTDGANPEAKQLAQQIIDSQQAEIDTMQEILGSL